MCAIVGVWDNVKPPFVVSLNFYVKLKDIYKCVSCLRCDNIKWTTEDSHIIILNRPNDFRHTLKSDIQRALLTNEWIPGKILFRIKPENGSSRWGEIKKTGAYVNRRFSRVEDVRFEDPYAPNKASTMENELLLLDETLDIQQQQQSSSLFNPTIPLESEISEVSSEFSAQSRDYSEESMKIESTTSQSRKVDEVEGGLESQKQFRNSMVLTNELDERLTRIRKMKEDLGEKLSDIKAHISAIEANHSSIKTNISAIKAIIPVD